MHPKLEQTANNPVRRIEGMNSAPTAWTAQQLRESAADLGEIGGGSKVDTLSGMEPADVTAVRADVVAEVLGDPTTFLEAAARATPGWAARYGGPEGVAQLTSVLHDHLAELTKLNADLRLSTLLYLRKPGRWSFAELGELLGVSRQTVQRTLARANDEDQDTPRRFASLESRSGWDS